MNIYIYIHQEYIYITSNMHTDNITCNINEYSIH